MNGRHPDEVIGFDLARLDIEADAHTSLDVEDLAGAQRGSGQPLPVDEVFAHRGHRRPGGGRRRRPARW